ncbi:MAG: flavodoxin [Ruminiclostridium sp.]|nr:flavodoxin [Ruminiclostridium sp.]
MAAAVIYWSGTGNTEKMAKAVAEGAGVEAVSVSDLKGDIAAFDAIALGSPAMGDEVLEESEFEPFFAGIEGKISGKKIALFGSYDWGDGQWMRTWEDRVKAAGAELINGAGIISNLEPSDDILAQCKELGKALVG